LLWFLSICIIVRHRKISGEPCETFYDIAHAFNTVFFNVMSICKGIYYVNLHCAKNNYQYKVFFFYKMKKSQIKELEDLYCLRIRIGFTDT